MIGESRSNKEGNDDLHSSSSTRISVVRRVGPRRSVHRTGIPTVEIGIGAVSDDEEDYRVPAVERKPRKNIAAKIKRPKSAIIGTSSLHVSKLQTHDAISAREKALRLDLAMLGAEKGELESKVKDLGDHVLTLKRTNRKILEKLIKAQVEIEAVNEKFRFLKQKSSLLANLVPTSDKTGAEYYQELRNLNLSLKALSYRIWPKARKERELLRCQLTEKLWNRVFSALVLGAPTAHEEYLKELHSGFPADGQQAEPYVDC